jgi:hypothetical protein
MKNRLIVPAALLLLAGNALAGVGYDSCIKEEKALKLKEADDCSGLKYLLNPSGCFATRKVMKEYDPEKCKRIGRSENVDVTVKKTLPERKDISSSSPETKKTEAGPVQQELTIEQLKAENSRFKTEIIRLTTENEQLRKSVR